MKKIITIAVVFTALMLMLTVQTISGFEVTHTENWDGESSGSLNGTTSTIRYSIHPDIWGTGRASINNAFSISSPNSYFFDLAYGQRNDNFAWWNLTNVPAYIEKINFTWDASLVLPTTGGEAE